MENKDYVLAGLGTFITIAVPVLVAAFMKIRKQSSDLRVAKRKQDKNDRKDTTDEYVQIIQKQNEIINNQESKMSEVKEELRAEAEEQKKDFNEKFHQVQLKLERAEERSQKCEKEHAGTFATLRIVLAWAKQRGLKIPDSVLPDGMGSDLHRPLTGQDPR